MARTLKAAVLLAGCGHMDGAEIREAVFTLLALDQHGVHVQCVAPNADQHHVVDHATGRVMEGQTRNILSESSRIARAGQCMDIAHARSEDFDMLLIPGGYGVAKNHCDFAFKGIEATVREDVRAFIQGFFQAKKPVGAICISPALVALVLASTRESATLTLGNGAEIQKAMEALGHAYQSVPSAREIVIDEAHQLVTTGAYMFDHATLNDVWTGIERCVAEVVRRA